MPPRSRSGAAEDDREERAAAADAGSRAEPGRGRRAARLVRALVAAAALLGALTPLLVLAWDRDRPLVALPWFNAFALTFQALACVSASFLVLGRYTVLRDPASYWTGVGFSTYGLALVYYVLAWPGLLPGGGSFLGALPGTAAWFTLVAGAALWGFLLAGATARWPAEDALRGARWLGTVLAWLGVTTLVCALVLVLERRLPTLVRPDGGFTPALGAANAAMTALFAVGTVVAALRARRTGDPLPALTGFMQLAFFFVGVWLVVGPVRYGPWWYLARAALTAGALVVLFGLLSEHVRLLRREREKTRSLSARSAELLAAEARLREHYARLQEAHARLQDADRRKNEFIAMLSHELRNPLAPISTALHVLEAAEPGGQQARRARDVLRRQVDHLTRLVGDLLDATRLGSGKVELRRAALDLVAVVRHAGDDHRALMQERGVALAIEAPPGPLRIEGDGTRLAQALGNLLQNAAKFTPAGGRVTVAVTSDGTAAEVRVRDTGSGIAPDLIERIFEPFTQGPQTLARSSGGLGLGLALVKGIVELHGGTVAARSDGEGAGAEFSVRLPLSGDGSGGETP